MIPPDIQHRQIKAAKTNNTGAATNKAIVAAKVDTKFRVCSIAFTSSVAADFTLEDADGTQIMKALNITALVLGPEMLMDEDFNTTSAANKALQYDTTTGNSEITVQYYEKDVS